MNPFKKYIENYRKALDILNYYKPKTLSDEEKIWLQYLNKHKYFYNNNKFRFQSQVIDKYGRKKVNVYKDEKTQLYYVIHKNKKLFWPRSMDKNTVINLYRVLLFEQDPKSPHLYWKENEVVYKNKILFDIGSAEGLISLEHIEDIKHVYLFECEASWIEALQETFKPYTKKTTIIEKYVSDLFDSKSKTITIDEFVKQSGAIPDLIKMDIEGFEEKALDGAIETLKNYHINLAVCSYHKPDAEKNITTFFNKLNYTYEISEGCIIHDEIPPYFRHGVVRAKSESC